VHACAKVVVIRLAAPESSAAAIRLPALAVIRLAAPDVIRLGAPVAIR
jgi:hypothetical protein